MNILQSLKSYLNKTLGFDLRSEPWMGANVLSFTLRDRYGYFQADILGCRCLLVIDKSEDHCTPSVIRKHIELIKKEWPEDVIYVRNKVTAITRKRLIYNKIAFVIPGNQLYLPTLAIDLREHFACIYVPVKYLSPAAQVLALHSIYKHYNVFCSGLLKTEIARQLGYTKMTMTRAFRELEGALADKGNLKKEEGLVLWKQLLALMRSPVRSRYFYEVDKAPDQNNIFVSGESALAHYTMLTDSARRVICMSSERWKAFHKEHAVFQIDYPEQGSLEVEVWRYKPQLVAFDNIADPLSVLLSIESSGNERVEMALQKIREDYLW